MNINELKRVFILSIFTPIVIGLMIIIWNLIKVSIVFEPMIYFSSMAFLALICYIVERKLNKHYNLKNSFSFIGPPATIIAFIFLFITYCSMCSDWIILSVLWLSTFLVTAYLNLLKFEGGYYILESRDRVTKYQKLNTSMGIIVLLYPWIKLLIDNFGHIFRLCYGTMIFFPILILISIIGFILGIIQRRNEYALKAKWIFLAIIVLFIVQVILSMFRVIFYL